MFENFFGGNREKGYKDIPVAEFKELMHKEDAFVLDVRQPQEVPDGTIEGFQMISFGDIDFYDHLKHLDKDKTYLVYCRSGNRSGQACRIMHEMGFERLYNLSGGIIAWNMSH